MLNIKTPQLLVLIQTLEQRKDLTPGGVALLKELQEIRSYIEATGDLLEALADVMPPVKEQMDGFLSGEKPLQ